MSNTSSQANIMASYYTNNYIGKQTLEAIKEDIKILKETGYKEIVVDLEDKSLGVAYVKEIAEMTHKNVCIFKGLGSKEQAVDAYLKTGYFLKEELGSKVYISKLKAFIEDADYPLMIKDNRLQYRPVTDMNIIKPVKFDNKYFHYQVIKPAYLEPILLEEAVLNDEDIFTNESMHILDIPLEETGLRFAADKRERTLLDVFEGVLNSTITGFFNRK